MKTYRYVRWNRLADYLHLGWLPVADLGAYHGQWSVLCEWKCNCPCAEPRGGEKR
jgi:hypothetical protein